MFGYKRNLILLSIIAVISAAENVTTTLIYPSMASTQMVHSTSAMIDSISTMVVSSSEMVMSSSVSPSFSSAASDAPSSMISISSSAMVMNSSSISPTPSVISSTAAPSNESSVPTSSSIFPSSSVGPTTSPTTPPTTTPRPDYDLKINITKNGTYCMWLEASIIIHYKYNKSHDLSGQYQFVQEDLDFNDYSCSPLNETGQTSFVEITQNNNQLLLEFTKSKSGWYVSTINASVDVGDGSNKVLSGSMVSNQSSNDDRLQGQDGCVYKCDVKEKVELTPNEGTESISVEFEHINVQPFEGEKSEKVTMCPSPEKPTKSSSVVPIAVGCALAGLIVIVLIAYLIGRRKSDAKGYQQV